MNSCTSRFLFILAITYISSFTCSAQNYVWWEGEDTLESNFPEKSWFSASTFKDKADRLSGGRWLTNTGKRKGDEAFARYSVEVPATGKYALWTRKFWKHGPFKWRFDSQAWRNCGKDIVMADSTEIRTHLCANWVPLGKVELKKGNHVFELRLLAGEGEDKTACFDCFVISMDSFEPNGKMKPGEKSGESDTGFFAWEPSPDPFKKEALLDLRYLNEKYAGINGHVKRKGNNFILGDGRSIRFWGANVNSGNSGQDHASIDYLARKLAKLGVNMVRFHSGMFSKEGDPARVDKKSLDNLHYLISAMKREGIYTKVSFYFPLWFHIKESYGIEGFDRIKNKVPFALLYFNPRMQEIYKSWAKTILTTVNPYTGSVIAEDPAVAIMEIINEDSFFFWTFNKKSIPEKHWSKLEQIYNQWLDKNQPQEAPHTRALYDAWHMTRDGIKKTGGGNKEKIKNQIRFLTEFQRGFYEEMTAYFKNDLGFKGLVSASNWQTADDVLLGPLERYTYTAGDVIDRHGYFGGTHKGDGSSYSVREGHTYKDRSGLLDPESLPIQVLQVAGYPHIISELGWPNPNRYKAESTAICSAYASLQGIDGLFWFAVENNTLSDKSLKKFAVGTPSIAAMFPAMALQYRRGDIKEARPVVVNRYKIEDLYALKGGAATAQALDKLRKDDTPNNTGKNNDLGIDPLLFYAGGVFQEFSDTNKSKEVDKGESINRKTKKVLSITEELLMDYESGLLIVNTPRSRGLTGFCGKKGETSIGNVKINCANEYASITVISLDGRPLDKAEKLLIQSMTYDQPFGYRSDNGRINNLGRTPFGVEEINADITIRFSTHGRAKVSALDENGYIRETQIRIINNDESLRFKLEKDSVYHVIER